MLEELDSPPKKSDAFFWADFIELNAISHPDKCWSRGDLVGVATRGKDKGTSFNPEIRWNEVLNFIESRVSTFQDLYPFEVSDDRDTLSLKEEGSKEADNYISLLIASGMRHVSRDHRPALARYFEEACYLIFTKLVPEGSQIRATWAGGGSAAVYTGTLYEKMNLIATDIRCTANFDEDDFKARDRGDGGIDLIAWHPMGDDREGLPISFAQCGCSKEDWKFKQLEASFAKHGRNLPVMHRWANYYFMPLDLRRSDGNWAYKSDIGEAIIVDRLRFLRLAQQYEILDQMPSFALP